MTTTLSAAALRMPHTASVAAPAPLAPGVSAEPWTSGFGGIVAPAFAGRQGDTDGSDRFGGITRSGIGGGWHRQDQGHFAGGGPLRG
jgi:hypothetical protein